MLDPYVEYGASAIDNIDGDISNNIDISGTVDVNTVGTYYVTYNVSDACGNVAIEKVRTINVVDTTLPVITLIGASNETIEVHSTYIDPGVYAVDNYDGDISNNVSVTNNVNINLIGTYTIVYNVTDTNGNNAIPVTRTVSVVDTTAPVITLIGVSYETIEVNTEYIEQGATVIDNYDNDISKPLI